MSEHAGAIFEMLSIDKITLDLENPRIAKWLEMYEGDPPAEQSLWHYVPVQVKMIQVVLVFTA